MSFHTWITYGYGICTDKITSTVEKIEELLSQAPDLQENIHEWFSENEINNPKVNDYLAYDEDYCGGYATLLLPVIEEAEGIEFCFADDYNGSQFLLYTPHYPWYLPAKEKNIKTEDIERILKKYVSILTDQEIEVEYHSVENGG